jgi:hypothetical protein
MARQLRLFSLLTAAVVGIAGLVPAQEVSKLGMINSQDILTRPSAQRLTLTAEVLRRYDVLKAAPPAKK